MVAMDLLKDKERIIDIAIKYEYDSAISFSRAFKRMMGFNPSEIGNNQKLKIFQVLKFNENQNSE